MSSSIGRIRLLPVFVRCGGLVSLRAVGLPIVFRREHGNLNRSTSDLRRRPHGRSRRPGLVPLSSCCSGTSSWRSAKSSRPPGALCAPGVKFSGAICRYIPYGSFATDPRARNGTTYRARPGAPDADADTGFGPTGTHPSSAFCAPCTRGEIDPLQRHEGDPGAGKYVAETVRSAVGRTTDSGRRSVGDQPDHRHDGGVRFQPRRRSRHHRRFVHRRTSSGPCGQYGLPSLRVWPRPRSCQRGPQTVVTSERVLRDRAAGSGDLANASADFLNERPTGCSLRVGVGNLR